ASTICCSPSASRRRRSRRVTMADAAKMAGAGKLVPPVRPEFERRELAESSFGAVERPLSAWERLTTITAARRTLIVVLLAAAWEVYARWLDNSLIFPTFSQTVTALVDAFRTGPLLGRTLTTLQVLLMGYAAGLLLAAVFTTLAVSTRIGTDLLST